MLRSSVTCVRKVVSQQVTESEESRMTPRFLAENLEAAEKDQIGGEDEPRSEAADGETPSVHPRDGPVCGQRPQGDAGQSRRLWMIVEDWSGFYLGRMRRV